MTKQKLFVTMPLLKLQTLHSQGGSSVLCVDILANTLVHGVVCGTAVLDATTATRKHVV
jgi:hypothetical protein